MSEPISCGPRPVSPMAESEEVFGICLDCGDEWADEDAIAVCPSCGSLSVIPVDPPGDADNDFSTSHGGLL